MLGAPDGHAKNFSIALLRQGRIRLTPIYDVMSIWPIEGKGANEFSRHDITMAMAVSGTSKHYKFKEIQRRHFNAMARKCQYGADAEDLIGQVLAATPGVIERVAAKLPPGFPAIVADRILTGVRRAANVLERMPSA